MLSLKYAKLVDKRKAKSKVWTHFGFPADDDGTILRQKKFVCRLCKTVIPYSGNTSNQTYHLQRELKHPCDHSKLFPEQGPSDNGKKTGSSSDATKLKQVTLGRVIAKSAPYPCDGYNSDGYS